MSLPLHPGQLVENLKGDLSGENEASRIVFDHADDGALEVQTITFPAGDGATQGDFIVLGDVAGGSIALWLDVDADGTAPSGTAAEAADAKVEVDVVAAGTPTTAAAVAALAKTAIEADLTLADYTIVDNEDGTLTITQDLMGNVAAPAPSNSAENGVGSILGTTDTAGADSSFQDTYVLFRDGSNAAHYAWFNVNGEGVDPAPGGTGVEVEFAAGASMSVMGAALAAAINTVSGMDADSEGNGVKLAASALAALTDLGAGDAPVTVSVQAQGAAKKFSHADAPSTISNNPSTF